MSWVVSACLSGPQGRNVKRLEMGGCERIPSRAGGPKLPGRAAYRGYLRDRGLRWGEFDRILGHLRRKWRRPTRGDRLLPF